MKHPVIPWARKKMPLTVGLTQAATDVFREVSPTKNKYLGDSTFLNLLLNISSASRCLL